MHIAFITSKEAKLAHYFPTKAEPDLIPIEPPFTPDDQLVVNALRNMGVSVHPLIWGKEDIDQLKSFDLLVMRSPWDYMDTLESKKLFIEWLNFLKENDIRVENNIDFMLWLINKKYLKDIENEGVKIIPTKVIELNQIVSLEKEFIDLGPLVIKPSCSASGQGLHCIQTRARAKDFQEEFDLVISKESHLIQPLIEAIKTHGEWSLIFIDGNYSHAVHKTTAENSILSHTEYGGSLNFREAPTDLISYAENILPKISEAFRIKSGIENTYIPLYLRCDFIEDKGQYLLSECEGVEPELFFRSKPQAAQTFARSLVAKF